MPPPINRLPRARPAPNAVPRPAPDAIARPVPDEVLRQVAELAHVPTAQHEFFFEVVRDNVQTACELSALVMGGLANKKGATLLRAALTLYDALGNLNNDEREFIEGILGRTGLFEKISSGRVGGLRQTAYQFALLFSLITGKPLPRYPHQSPQQRQRGPKLGTVKHPIFHKFAFDIYLSAKVAGGNLTFDKNVPLGTSWLEAIEMLAPTYPQVLCRNLFPVRLYNGYRLGAMK
jgi:hypothetical protein